jgi:hypothetical protein
VVAAVGDLLAQFLLLLPEIVHKTPCVCVAAATTTKKKKKKTTYYDGDKNHRCCCSSALSPQSRS